MKKVFFKWLLIFVIVTIIIVGISGIYLVYSTSIIKEEYEKAYDERSIIVATNFSVLIDDAKEVLESKTISDDENVFALGEIIEYEVDDEDEENTDTFLMFEYTHADSSKNGKEEITQQDRDRLYTAIDSVESEIIASEESFSSRKFILLGAKVEEEYRFAVVDGPTLIKNINLLDGMAISLARKNGEAILSSIQGSEIVLDAIYGAEYNKLDTVQSSKYLSRRQNSLFVTVTKTEISGIYLVTEFSGNDVFESINSMLKTSIIYAASIAVVSYIATIVALVIYIYLNNRNLVGKFQRGKYSLIVDSYGKVLFSNAKFKKDFDVDSLLESIIDDRESLTEALKESGDITAKIKNVENNERYIRFMSSRTLQGYKLLGTDITDFMDSYISAKKQAYADYKTQLPSYDKLVLDFAKYPKEYQKESFCIAILSLKDIEIIKNMFGHNIAEEVRMTFAKRLNDLFKDMVYHCSDTRFIVFAKTIKFVEFLNKNIERVSNILTAPTRIGAHTIQAKFHGGISQVFSSISSLSLEQVLKQANLALNSSVSLNKKFTVYYEALTRNDLAIYEERRAILELLEKDLLTLHYQPQYSISKEKIVGFEALLRLKKKSNISIAQFIELAEKNGSIIEIGNFVYKTAMNFAKKLNNEITISLNVSAFQLICDGFTENLLKHYKAANLKPHSIALEITESYLMSDYEGAIEKLSALKREGIDIHLDDFGVAYSSMLYLKKLPINTIKIDRGFIKDLTSDRYSQMIVEIISKSSKLLGLSCIAEGVETIEQAKLLKDLDCDIIQGFLLSKAVPKEEALKMISENKRMNL